MKKKSEEKILEEIIGLSSSLRSAPDNQTLFHDVARLTNELIKLYVEEGNLQSHPYSQIKQRTTPIDKEVVSYIKSRRVLVTGAAGCIGAALIQKLSEFEPKKIIAIDKDQDAMTRLSNLVSIDAHIADISDRTVMERIYSSSAPQVVFHLAAEREARKAENHVRPTILTNILGTRNACELAAENGVERFIHASTGKCRHIYDERIYPATKQLAEFEVRRNALAAPQTRWSCVRFHHVVDNSIVERIFFNQIDAGQFLTLHLPTGRKKHGQNAAEAVAMLLNGGLLGNKAELFASSRQMDDFSVLKLALYLIVKSGKELPIVFFEPKNTEGYNPDEFPGERRPITNDYQRLTHGFNTIETDFDTFTFRSDLELISTPFVAFDERLANNACNEIIAEAETASDSRISIYKHLETVAASVYRLAPSQRLTDALFFCNRGDFLTNHQALTRFSTTLRLLLDGLIANSSDISLSSIIPMLEKLNDCKIKDLSQRTHRLLNISF